MAADFGDQGLVLIGVHTEKAWETMEAYIEREGIKFPVCVDTEGTIAAFGVDSFPDYCLIDRQGILRVADLANGGVDDAVQVLLAEDDHLSAAMAAGAQSAPDVTFDMFEGDERIGTFRMVTDVSMIGDTRVVATSSVSTRFDPEDPDAKAKVESSAAVYALGPQLTPLHFTTVDSRGGRHESEVRVEDDAWVVDPEGGNSQKIPAGALFDSLMYRLVTGFPEVEGYRVTAPWFEMEELVVHGAIRIECMGEEKHDGKPAWRWDLEFGELRGVTMTMQIWTTGGEIVEMEANGRRLVPAVEER